MSNTTKMFKAMVGGLRERKNFSSKWKFRAWYWNQIPDERYPSETLEDAWGTFLDKITLGELRWRFRIWVGKKGKRYYGHSATFNKDGYFFREWRTGHIWFNANDGSISTGTPNYALDGSTITFNF